MMINQSLEWFFRQCSLEPEDSDIENKPHNTLDVSSISKSTTLSEISYNDRKTKKRIISQKRKIHQTYADSSDEESNSRNVTKCPSPIALNKTLRKIYAEEKRPIKPFEKKSCRTETTFLKPDSKKCPSVIENFNQVKKHNFFKIIASRPDYKKSVVASKCPKMLTNERNRNNLDNFLEQYSQKFYNERAFKNVNVTSKVKRDALRYSDNIPSKSSKTTLFLDQENEGRSEKHRVSRKSIENLAVELKNCESNKLTQSPDSTDLNFEKNGPSWSKNDKMTSKRLLFSKNTHAEMKKHDTPSQNKEQCHQSQNSLQKRLMSQTKTRYQKRVAESRLAKDLIKTYKHSKKLNETPKLDAFLVQHSQKSNILENISSPKKTTKILSNQNWSRQKTRSKTDTSAKIKTTTKLPSQSIVSEDRPPSAGKKRYSQTTILRYFKTTKNYNKEKNGVKQSARFNNLNVVRNSGRGSLSIAKENDILSIKKHGNKAIMDNKFRTKLNKSQMEKDEIIVKERSLHNTDLDSTDKSNEREKKQIKKLSQAYVNNTKGRTTSSAEVAEACGSRRRRTSSSDTIRRKPYSQRNNYSMPKSIGNEFNDIISQADENIQMTPSRESSLKMYQTSFKTGLIQRHFNYVRNRSLSISSFSNRSTLLTSLSSRSKSSKPERRFKRNSDSKGKGDSGKVYHKLLSKATENLQNRQGESSLSMCEKSRKPTSKKDGHMQTHYNYESLSISSFSNRSSSKKSLSTKSKNSGLQTIRFKGKCQHYTPNCHSDSKGRSRNSLIKLEKIRNMKSTDRILRKRVSSEVSSSQKTNKSHFGSICKNKRSKINANVDVLKKDYPEKNLDIILGSNINQNKLANSVHESNIAKKSTGYHKDIKGKGQHSTPNCGSDSKEKRISLTKFEKIRNMKSTDRILRKRLSSEVSSDETFISLSQKTNKSHFGSIYKKKRSKVKANIDLLKKDYPEPNLDIILGRNIKQNKWASTGNEYNNEKNSTRYHKDVKGDYAKTRSDSIRKSQRNMVSSEGFHESTSYEFPTPNINETQRRINENNYSRDYFATRFNLFNTKRDLTKAINKNVYDKLNDQTLTVQQVKRNDGKSDYNGIFEANEKTVEDSNKNLQNIFKYHNDKPDHTLITENIIKNVNEKTSSKNISDRKYDRRKFDFFETEKRRVENLSQNLENDANSQKLEGNTKPRYGGGTGYFDNLDLDRKIDDVDDPSLAKLKDIMSLKKHNFLSPKVENFGKKISDVRLLTDEAQVDTRAVQKLPLNRSIISKGSLSDPISLGQSPCFMFSANEIPIGLDSIQDRLDKENSGFSLPHREDHISKMFNPNPLQDITSNRNGSPSLVGLASKKKLVDSRNKNLLSKDKLDSQTLDELCRIHESSNWETNSLIENKENLTNKKNCSDNTQTFSRNENGINTNIISLQEHCTPNSSNYIINQKPFTNISKHVRKMSKIEENKNYQPHQINNDANLNDINSTSFNQKPNTIENNSTNVQTEKSISLHSKMHSFNHTLPLKMLDPMNNFVQPISENIFNTKPAANQNNINLVESFSFGQSPQTNVYHTQTNCEEDIVFTQNSEIFTQENEILTQSQSLTQNLTESKSDTRETNVRHGKSYSITPSCILYEDNLLKELLEEKCNILNFCNKNKLKRADSEESDILAKTYIKRYRKDKTRIFKIKKRFKRDPQDNYEPPEDHIMDRFINRLNNNFKDESSSGNEDRESVSTPKSYKTDETKSEVLSTGSAKLSDHQKLLREGVNKLSKDRSLVFSRFSDSAPKETDSKKILIHIQETILGVLNDYEQGKDPSFKFPRIDYANCVFKDERYQIKEVPEYTTVTYKYPVRRAKFNLMLFVLNKIRILLETSTKLTKREIYYQLKTMILNQYITDSVIGQISRMLNVGVWALNLTAQKGLVYGNLKLIMENGETINCNVPGTLVPKDVSEICEIQSDAYFILVVEKESIFHKLLEENLPNRLTRPFILITGKGFPDLNTQLFLKKLWMIMTVPVFILVDADPDGIAIMLNYRFGSVANAHVSEHLAIPKARWIGVFPSEILKLNLTSEPLNKREIAKTQKLLQLRCVQENEKINTQLETLLENQIKSGIEGLIKTETYLSHRYLSYKFYTNDLI